MRVIITDPYNKRETETDLCDHLEPQGAGGIESDIRACQRTIGRLAELMVEAGFELQAVCDACGSYGDVRAVL